MLVFENDGRVFVFLGRYSSNEFVEKPIVLVVCFGCVCVDEELFLLSLFEKLDLRNASIRVGCDLTENLLVERVQLNDSLFIEEIAVVLPASEKLATGFFENKSDFELRLARRQIDSLHRDIADMEGVSALSD